MRNAKTIVRSQSSKRYCVLITDFRFLENVMRYFRLETLFLRSKLKECTIKEAWANKVFIRQIFFYRIASRLHSVVFLICCTVKCLLCEIRLIILVVLLFDSGSAILTVCSTLTVFIPLPTNLQKIELKLKSNQIWSKCDKTAFQFNFFSLTEIFSKFKYQLFSHNTP
jgi:hypothetical protein